MTTAVRPVAQDGANESYQLEKAADQYKLAAHHYHEASKKQAHGHDDEGDHHVRHGVAHALHAEDHADLAARLHATGMTDCACSSDTQQ